MTAEPILLVEDNPDDVTLTVRALRKNDIENEVVVAGDGEQALALLHPPDGTPLKPALVLLDVKLPLVAGLDVLRKIRADERTRMLPVVMLTTSNEARDITDSYQLGANSFVRKPVEFSDFIEVTRLLGRYWLVLNQPVPTRLGGV